MKSNDRAARIYEKLRGARGVDEDELWQHALFFAMSPEERCRFSLKTARSALSLKRSVKEGIDCILIDAMAAIRQGAPLMTVDYDFWVRLPERHYVRLLAIVQRQRGSVRARTLYELSDGTQVNAVFQPNGLHSFGAEWKRCHRGRLEGIDLRILPLERVIASKRAAGRDKDLAVCRY